MKTLTKILLLCLFWSGIAKAETEPNDSWNQANVIAVGATGTGTASLNYDEDWWRVDLPGDGKLTVNWSSLNGNYVWCNIYDTLGTFLFTSSYTSSSTVLNVDGLMGGSYYLKFVAFYNNESTNYSFVPTFTAASVPNDIEPNGIYTQSHVLALNDTVTGHIGYYHNNVDDTLDWWSVTTNLDGRLDFSLTSLNGQNVYAELFDGNGTSILAGNYTTATGNYSKDGLAPGTYYIRVRTFYINEFAPYILRNNLVLPINSSESGIFNGNAANALPINLGDSINGHIGYYYNGLRDTLDWFKVTTTLDGAISFTIRSLNGQNVYAELFDGDATTYLEGNYTTSAATFYQDGLAPGEYYIRIRTFYSAEFAPYSLKTNFIAPVNGTESLLFNGVPANATVITLGDSVNGHIGYAYNGNRDDFDWYTFTTNADGQVNFNLYSLNGQYVYLELFDTDGATYLAGSYTPSSGTYTGVGLAAGTYYFRVKSYYSYEWAPYSFRFNLVPATPANDIEPNGNIGNALPLVLNSSTTGHVNFYTNLSRDTSDWYAVTLPLDGKLNWTIASSNNQYVYAQLYDHNGTTLLGGGYSNSSISFAENNLAAGTYYMSVHTYYNYEYVPYTLTNTFEPMTFTVENPATNNFAISANILPANTPKTGHINFYYDLQFDAVDWWVIGYDGTGALTFSMDIEQNHFDGARPYINYAIYSDTAAASLYSGQWNAATNTRNITGLPIGQYYVKITPYSSDFGAYQLHADYVERCANIVAINSSSQLAGCNGTITYQVSNGLAPYSVQLYKDGLAFGAPVNTNLSGGVTFNALGIGTYFAKAYSFGASGSCNNQSSSTVFSLPAVPTISAGGSTTFCQGGSVTLTSSAATSYLWSTGETTQAINATIAGNYVVTVSNAAGCTNQSVATIVTVNSNPATPTITPNGATTFCQGGSVILTSTSATSYVWSTGATTQAIPVNANGSFSVTVSNANGCTATSGSTNVTVNANPVAGIGGITTICSGTSTTLTATGGGTYLWSTGATTAAISVSPLINTNYTVTVTNANNCSATASTTVNVNSSSAASISGTLTICSGGSTILTSSAGNSYLWSTGATTQAISVSPISNTTYSVTVTYIGGCTATTSATVNVNSSPSASISGTLTICSGGSTTLTSSVGNSYLWSTGATTQAINVSPVSNTSYSVTVTYSGGCTATTSATVNVNSSPSASISGTLLICSGGSTTLTSSVGNSYLWSTGATTQAINVSPVSNTSYSVTVTYAGGCTAVASATVNVNASSAASISGTTTICSGSSTTLTSSAGNSYLWSTGATTQAITVNPLSNTTYSLTVTYVGGCTANGSALVTVNLSPTASAGPNQVICSSSPVLLNGTIGGSATSGTWSSSGTGSFSPSANTLNATYTPSPADITAGSVILTLTSNTVNVCAPASSSMTLTLTAGGPVIGAISGPAALCNPVGLNITYFVSPVAGATLYTWTVPTGGTIKSGQGSNSIVVNFTNGAIHSGISGDICVTANIPVSGCGSATTCLAISVQAVAPVSPPSISGANKVCPGESQVYSIASVLRATSYNWTVPAGANIISGQGTNIITVAYTNAFASGNVSVSAINQCGASPYRTRGITLNNLSATSVISGQPTGVCGQVGVVYSVAALVGATTYQWSVPAGVTITGPIDGSSITVDFVSHFTSGNITVSGVNGCGVGIARSLTVTGAPGLPGNIAGPTTVCTGQTYTYSVATVVGANTFNWTVPTGCTILTGQGTKIITVKMHVIPGTNKIISVDVTNNCGTSAIRRLNGISIIVCPRIGDGNSSDAFNVYPNPASDYITIESPQNSIDENASIATEMQILDLSGKVVMKYNITRTTEKVDVSILPNGVYFIQLTTSDLIVNKKIVISH